MRTQAIVGLCAALTIAQPALATEQSSPMPLHYPATPRVEQTDTHFGVTIADPYRWLENDIRQDARVQEWVDAENKLTHEYLDALPKRAEIAHRLSEIFDYEKFRVPQEAGGRVFYEHNSGLQNQFVLQVLDKPGAKPRNLLDPNQWAKDGATALDAWAPSHDGKHVVYSVEDGGSDWRTVNVLDVATGKDLPDQLHWVKFSGMSWAADGSGFFYSRFPEPAKGAELQSTNLDQRVYFHKLGSAQENDRLIYATPDRPKLLHQAEASFDGHYLVIASAEGTDDRNEVTLIDLHQPKTPPRTLVKGLEHSYRLIEAVGSHLYFVTNLDAPRYRIVAMDLAKPGLTEIVPQSAATIEGASLIGKKLLVQTIEDAKSVVFTTDLTGGDRRAVELPGIGSVSGFAGRPDSHNSYYGYSSFNAPLSIFSFDAGTGKSTLFKAPEVKFKPDDYVVEQVFYPSKDGTKIPMFIVHKTGLDTSKPHPTLLYAYGGFNISMLPSFSVSRLEWMEMGGVYALANLRGGGEYGKDWHDAGRLMKKQNVFDDFIAGAEYLIGRGITTSAQLAIQGGSNGGLLVGAVVNQRPDLFAAALPAVGVMDMLRFDQFTAGRFWTDDYGSPSVEADFRYLWTYSPIHNVHAGAKYPAILITTADTDDRVVPGHSFKYAATLQNADLGPEPHLIRVETRAGHGSGKPTDKQIQEVADLWAFAGYHTGLTR